MDTGKFIICVIIIIIFTLNLLVQGNYYKSKGWLIYSNILNFLLSAAVIYATLLELTKNTGYYNY